MSGTVLAEQFEDLEQQERAAEFGIWIFLGSELLFFGGLFLALAVYRTIYADVFREGTRQLHFALGTLNTGILLTSSWTMAMAVKGAGEGQKSASRWLWATVLLGSIFLAVKGVEYHAEWREQLVPGWNLNVTRFSSVRITLFFLLYFLMTGLHGLHLTVGLALIGRSALRLWWNGPASEGKRVEIIGLYWHFVDLVWVFLYPMLYLLGRS